MWKHFSRQLMWLLAGINIFLATSSERDTQKWLMGNVSTLWQNLGTRGLWFNTGIYLSFWIKVSRLSRFSSRFLIHVWFSVLYQHMGAWHNSYDISTVKHWHHNNQNVVIYVHWETTEMRFRFLCCFKVNILNWGTQGNSDISLVTKCPKSQDSMVHRGKTFKHLNLKIH